MSSTNDAPVTPQRLNQFAWGYSIPLIIEAALQNGVFDVLDKGPKSLGELAKATACTERGLRPVLNTLTALELLTKDAGGRYALGPEAAAFLVTTKPSFQGGIFRHVSKRLIPRWLHLTEIMKTGKPAQAVNQQGDGGAFFEELVADIFPMSYAATQALADSLQLAQLNQPFKVLDIASGSGVWGIGLAQKSKHVQVTAVDWPNVIGVTRKFAAKHGVAGQFAYVEGDMHSVDYGKGFHLATLGHILHSEGVARSQALLRKVSDALAPGGQIAIAEFLANDARSGPPNAMIFAVNMLINTDDGDTFSFEEIAKWLREAGFENPRTLDAPGPSPLILATKRK